VSDSLDLDNLSRSIYFVQKSIVADANSVGVFGAGELFAAGWKRICGESFRGG
jgi:hypothetical protein